MLNSLRRDDLILFKKKFSKFKNHVTEYLRCLFDINRTRYTNLEELTIDIEAHTIKYLKEMVENI